MLMMRPATVTVRAGLMRAQCKEVYGLRLEADLEITPPNATVLDVREVVVAKQWPHPRSLNRSCRLRQPSYTDRHIH